MFHKRLPDSQVASFDAYGYAAYVGTPIFHPDGRKATDELLWRCRVGAGCRALDVGCGTGYTVRSIARRSRALTLGIDSSLSMVETAREFSSRLERKGRVRFIHGDALHLPFDDGVFDIVVAEAVVMHLDLSEALNEFVRVLRRGGRLGLSTYTRPAYSEDEPCAPDEQEYIDQLSSEVFRLPFFHPPPEGVGALHGRVRPLQYRHTPTPEDSILRQLQREHMGEYTESSPPEPVTRSDTYAPSAAIVPDQPATDGDHRQRIRDMHWDEAMISVARNSPS